MKQFLGVALAVVSLLLVISCEAAQDDDSPP